MYKKDVISPEKAFKSALNNAIKITIENKNTILVKITFIQINDCILNIKFNKQPNGKNTNENPKNEQTPDTAPIIINKFESGVLIIFNFFKYIIIKGAVKNISIRNIIHIKAGINGNNPRIQPVINENTQIILS
ncbi:MAG: hypothetical protein LUG16_05985 [Candidatus Gastranaerophilales bacterium]|nr:hypothetical protein [Candidatus Gastranaerophilales bacterium]